MLYYYSTNNLEFLIYIFRAYINLALLCLSNSKFSYTSNNSYFIMPTFLFLLNNKYTIN